MKSRTLTLIANEVRGLFDVSAEPTLEGPAGPAGKDSFNRILLAGEQVADLLDGDRDGRLTVNSNGASAVFHLDLALDRRLRVDRVILDGHTLRKAYGDDVANLVKVLHNSTDNYGTATEVAASRVISGLLGRGRAYLDFDGIDDKAEKDTTSIPADYPFALGAWFKTTATATGALVFIGDKDSGDRYAWIGLNASGQAIMEVRKSGEGWVVGTSTAAYNNGKWHHAIGVFRSATDRELYVDGSSVATSTTSVVLSAGNDRVSIGVVGDLTPGAYFKGGIVQPRVWNRAPSAAEITSLHAGGVHTPIPTADQYGSQTNLITDTDDQDFTGGDIGNWIVSTDGNGTVDYHAGPGAEKTGRITVGATPGTYTIAQLPTARITTFKKGKNYRGSCDVYLPSANNNWTEVGIQTHGIDVTQISKTNAILTTEDVWQRVDYEFTAGSDVVGSLSVVGIGTTTGDTIFYDNVEVVEIGCVAEYNPEGISPTHGKWHDRSSNKLHATIAGAEARDVPISDEGEALLIELETEIDARYLYLKINPDGLTGDANVLVGQMAYSRAAALTGVKEFDEESDYPGIDVSQAYGGSEFPSVRYDGERPEWPLVLVGQLDAMVDDLRRVYRAAKGTRKVPLYLVEDITWNDDTKTRLIYGVKFDAPLGIQRQGKHFAVQTALRVVAG